MDRPTSRCTGASHGAITAYLDSPGAGPVISALGGLTVVVVITILLSVYGFQIEALENVSNAGCALDSKCPIPREKSLTLAPGVNLQGALPQGDHGHPNHGGLDQRGRIDSDDDLADTGGVIEVLDGLTALNAGPC